MTGKNDNRLFRVFVIDDDEINNFLCRKVLESSNKVYEVKSFLSSKKALDYIKDICLTNLEILPDIILLDINMPYMDGWEFLEKFEKILAKCNKDIPVAMLSSSVYQKDKERSAKYRSVIHYISKPLTSEQFEEIIYKINQ
jgi:CheY-like chemotaxis protein